MDLEEREVEYAERLLKLVEAGGKAERDSIVKYLRVWITDIPAGQGSVSRGVISAIADRIEQGDHLAKH